MQKTSAAWQHFRMSADKDHRKMDFLRCNLALSAHGYARQRKCLTWVDCVVMTTKKTQQQQQNNQSAARKI